MKNILTVIAMALIIFNTNANSNSSWTELEEQLYKDNQIAKINASMLEQLDREIGYVNKKFQAAIADSDAGDDIVEGKFLASMIFMIEDKLNQIEDERALLDDKYEIVDADIDAIKKDINNASDIIDAMNP